MVTLMELYIIKIKNRYHLIIITKKGLVHNIKITREDVDTFKVMGIKIRYKEKAGKV